MSKVVLLRWRTNGRAYEKPDDGVSKRSLSSHHCEPQREINFVRRQVGLFSDVVMALESSI